MNKLSPIAHTGQPTGRRMNAQTAMYASEMASRLVELIGPQASPEQMDSLLDNANKYKALASAH